MLASGYSHNIDMAISQTHTSRGPFAPKRRAERPRPHEATVARSDVALDESQVLLAESGMPPSSVRHQGKSVSKRLREDGSRDVFEKNIDGEWVFLRNEH